MRYPHLLLLPLLLLAGCSGPASENTTEAQITTETSENVAVSQVPSSVASTPVAGTTTSGVLLDAERAWVKHCQASLDCVTPTDPVMERGARYSKAQQEWNRAKEMYDSQIVPPRFAKADAVFRQGYDKAFEALELLRQATMRRRGDMDVQSEQIFGEADTLMRKGLEEIKAAGG